MITGKVIIKDDGTKKLEILNLTLYERTIRQFKEGSQVNITIEKNKKESRKQRGYYNGAVLPVWAYLNDMDWKDREVIDELHEIAKQQFNGALVVVDGTSHKIGKSTRQGALQSVIDGVIDHLESEYGIKRQECLDPEAYLYWKDVIFPTGSYDYYISYLSAIGKLPKK
jgi:hypothetical protein